MALVSRHEPLLLAERDALRSRAVDAVGLDYRARRALMTLRPAEKALQLAGFVSARVADLGQFAGI
jgi:hypothetical protein